MLGAVSNSAGVGPGDRRARDVERRRAHVEQSYAENLADGPHADRTEIHASRAEGGRRKITGVNSCHEGVIRWALGQGHDCIKRDGKRCGIGSAGDYDFTCGSHPNGRGQVKVPAPAKVSGKCQRRPSAIQLRDEPVVFSQGARFRSLNRCHQGNGLATPVCGVLSRRICRHCRRRHGDRDRAVVVGAAQVGRIDQRVQANLPRIKLSDERVIATVAVARVARALSNESILDREICGMGEPGH